METITKQQFISAVELVEYYPNALEIIKKYLEQLNIQYRCIKSTDIDQWLNTVGKEASIRLVKALRTTKADGTPYFSNIESITKENMLKLRKIGLGTWFEFERIINHNG
jgi:hypothetical protein